MQDVFILSAVRTPIGKFGGSLAGFSAPDLGVAAAQAAIEHAGVAPDQIDETIFGSARQAGNGPNPARQISIRAGVPKEVSANTVNQACASGMKAIANGYYQIAHGEMNCALVGGAESMSRVPYYLDNGRWGYRLGNADLVDGMYRDGFLCPLAKMVMGETAEILAEQYKISREEQDEFALRSQQRAERAIKSGRFKDEIVPVKIQSKKGETIFDTDEHPFLGATMEKLAKLAPVFKKDGGITAGNSSGITDGAAALVIAGADFVKKNNLKPLAKILATAQAGVDPKVMGIGPVPAVRKLEEKYRLRLQEFSLIELNEAFAAQVIACDRDLSMDPEKLNVNGGSIALGHPIGCTGARITVTLLHELLKRNGKRGLATLCVSGGMGMALAIENAN
ncbi:MAG TPA: acetyl-CoA C-acetyltransferase [Terriglobales bacterium]|nr:acetyl-CoA C-acetyltransferase [Terriglobales bacterium]